MIPPKTIGTPDPINPVETVRDLISRELARHETAYKQALAEREATLMRAQEWHLSIKALKAALEALPQEIHAEARDAG